MEFPDLGKHCSESTCKRLDFLPMKCDACDNVFCKDHILYTYHNCPAAYKKDIQVPVCPLCNKPVPTKRGELPDIKVGEHIDNDCQSDPAKAKRKVYTNRCSKKGCKQKEVIPVLCDRCRLNYCIKHRHEQDHDCRGQRSASGMSLAGAAAASRIQNQKPGPSGSRPGKQACSNPGSHESRLSPRGMDEDEALARAVQLSLMDNGNATALPTPPVYENEDMLLAQAIAASERDFQQQQQQRQRQEQKSTCVVN